MADGLSAAAREFPASTQCRCRPLRLPSGRYVTRAESPSLSSARRPSVTQSPAVLKEPWQDLGRQREGAAFGIWVFLASELLFFGGMILLYTVYRVENPQAF